MMKILGINWKFYPIGGCPNMYTNTTMINSRINVGLSKLILVRLLGALFPSAFDEKSFNFFKLLCSWLFNRRYVHGNCYSKSKGRELICYKA